MEQRCIRDHRCFIRSRRNEDSVFFEDEVATCRRLCINDPSNKQKLTLYSKCAKLSDAKCFESIAQCCCFHKPKKG